MKEGNPYYVKNGMNLSEEANPSNTETQKQMLCFISGAHESSLFHPRA